MIEFKSVKYSLGNKQFDYDFATNSSITGIYGPSGAGKTTLFNLLSGLYIPESGEINLNKIQLFNSNEKKNLPSKRRNIGYVFQENLLFPHLSVQKNLTFSELYIKKKKKNIQLQDVIELLDLESLLNQMPRQLSGGERQRVAIGRALLSQPSLLLLDEPFSNVDCSKRKQIISYLLSINHHFKVPMLIISHHLEDILKLTHQIILVENGKITATDHVFNLIKNGEKSNLIRPKKYQNTLFAYFNDFDKKDNVFILTTNNTQVKISTQSKLLTKGITKGTKIQLCIKPDDIALSLDYTEETSLQNQLQGKVTQIIENTNNLYCVVDCGFEVLVEISQAIREKLLLHKGQSIYCLINAKYFDVVHVFSNNEEEKLTEQSEKKSKRFSIHS